MSRVEALELMEGEEEALQGGREVLVVTGGDQEEPVSRFRVKLH